MLDKAKKALADWWACQTKRCTYYRHYLAYGPAELTHEGFHAAERHCEMWQRRAEEWLADHPEGQLPGYLEQICRIWEKRIRA